MRRKHSCSQKAFSLARERRRDREAMVAVSDSPKERERDRERLRLRTAGGGNRKNCSEADMSKVYSGHLVPLEEEGGSLR